MSGFRDLDEFFTDELRLPVGGTTYVIAGPDAETGLWCQRLAETGRAVAAGRDVADADLDEAEERELYQRLLGSTFERMCADGLSWGRIRHAGLTVFFWVVAGTEAAARYWESGGRVETVSGEAPAPNRAARRHPSPGSSGTDRSTPRRGSTTTTTSAPTARDATPERRAGSRGRTSSPTGR